MVFTLVYYGLTALIDNVYPRGASNLNNVSSCGEHLRLSILAISGCFILQTVASSLCEQ